MKKQILTVSEITQEIKRTLEQGLGYADVQGEISNFKLHTSGHRYFTLKDKDAQISCVMWRFKKLDFLPTDGMKVIIGGKLSVYAKRGQYQIDCDTIQPVGKGDLYLAFLALKEELEKLGYFEVARKKPLPRMPLKIGVATSPTGAAIRDILRTIERRAPVCEIYLRPTIVQGDEAAPDVADAIKQLDDSPAEVIIIGRGGGSLEDLWAFNEKIVADAILSAKKPIISAVGHETDFTIADFTADARAATPTAAGEIVTPIDIESLYENIDYAAETMTKNISNEIENLRREVDTRIESYAFKSVIDKIKNYRQFIDESDTRIKAGAKRTVERYGEKLSSLEKHCKSLYPLIPFDKGFALPMSENKIIPPDESLGNYIQIDVLRKNETAKANIVEIRKQKKFK